MKLVSLLAFASATMGLLSAGCAGSARPVDATPPVAPVTDAAAAAAERLAEEEARRRAAEAADREAAWNRDRAQLEEMVFFDFDQSEIRATDRSRMTAKAHVLRSWPQVRIRVDGHADERGSTEYNLALSMRRASTAKRFFTDHGVDGSRIEVGSWGEEQPLDARHIPEAWDRNRRAEFIILQTPVASRH